MQAERTALTGSGVKTPPCGRSFPWQQSSVGQLQHAHGALHSSIHPLIFPTHPFLFREQSWSLGNGIQIPIALKEIQTAKQKAWRRAGSNAIHHSGISSYSNIKLTKRELIKVATGIY